MSLLLTMLPIYVFGNLHCIGMCGPLVMTLGQHRYRYFYFLGRLLSFSLAGMLSGEMGAVFHLFLSQYYLSAAFCFLFGIIIIGLGLNTLMGWHYPGYQWIMKQLQPLNSWITLLILKDTPGTTFLFGFFTLALPCGQTLIVFSACALAGDPYVGLLNGIAFALLTSPALLLAMHTHTFIQSMKKHYNTIMGCLALFVGILACCRGLAELDIISHLVLNPDANPQYHIVLY